MACDYYTTIYERGLSFNEARSLCIADFRKDYDNAIRLLLKNKHLQLAETFGVQNSIPLCLQHNTPLQMRSPAFYPRWWTLRFNRLSWSTPCMGLKTLSKFCKIGEQKFHLKDRGLDHGQLVDEILNSGAGNLTSKSKAQALILCISNPMQTEWQFSAYKNKAMWQFKPSDSAEKEIGAVLRKLFIKHAGACIEAISSFRSCIVDEAYELLLIYVFKMLQNKYNMERNVWLHVLEFAGWHAFIKPNMDNLESLNKVLNEDITEFFLGGIASTLKRKYDLPPRCWKLVLEFSGWNVSLPPKNAVPVEQTIVRVGKRKRAD